MITHLHRSYGKTRTAAPLKRWVAPCTHGEIAWRKQRGIYMNEIGKRNYEAWCQQCGKLVIVTLPEREEMTDELARLRVMEGESEWK